MKEATGELNMTVITIIIISAIVGFFWIMWPRIKDTINRQWEHVGTESEEKANDEWSYLDTYKLPDIYI